MRVGQKSVIVEIDCPHLRTEAVKADEISGRLHQPLRLARQTKTIKRLDLQLKRRNEKRTKTAFVL